MTITLFPLYTAASTRDCDFSWKDGIVLLVSCSAFIYDGVGEVRLQADGGTSGCADVYDTYSGKTKSL
jgi:hypothetical protein